MNVNVFDWVESARKVYAGETPADCEERWRMDQIRRHLGRAVSVPMDMPPERYDTEIAKRRLTEVVMSSQMVLTAQESGTRTPEPADPDTVDGLIATLQALPADVRKLPVRVPGNGLRPAEPEVLELYKGRKNAYSVVVL